jgi:crotonobetainyl-CoA:carnitine CoA-transferase CaiB-like acyl-CoA transferase
MSSPSEGQLLPLSGVRVLDLTRNVAGPFASMILGDLGAEVLKIEAPHGDDARGWGPPFLGPDSLTFLGLNRNKRSAVVDLRAPEARGVMNRLVDDADVLLSSFRSGALDALGYGWDWACERNPAIIYVSITAFGNKGPLKDAPGYDPLIQAYAGLMSVTGESGRPPVRVGVSMIDSGTGMWAAMATLTALYERTSTGRGRRIETSLYETGLQWMATPIANYSGDHVNPARCGSGAASIVPYQAFPTTDGYLVIAAGNDQLFVKLARVLDRPEWLDEPRYRTNADRVGARDELVARIEAVTVAYHTADLSALLGSVGVPCSELRDVADLEIDRQAEALGIFHDLDGYESAPRMVRLPLSFDGERPPIRMRPPTLGEHTGEATAGVVSISKHD